MFFLLWHSHHLCLSCCQKKKSLSIVSIGRRIWPKEEWAYLLSAASITGTVGSKGLIIALLAGEGLGHFFSLTCSGVFDAPGVGGEQNQEHLSWKQRLPRVIKTLLWHSLGLPFYCHCCNFREEDFLLRSMPILSHMASKTVHAAFCSTFQIQSLFL